MTQHIKFLGMLAALSILVGCSSAGSSSGGGGSSAAPTATLSASPTSITSRQWLNTDVSRRPTPPRAASTQGVGPVGTKPGSVQVTPPVGVTTYTYTATGPGGTATASATVTVTQLGPPPTISLQASSRRDYRWPARYVNVELLSNATNVAIEPNPGGVQLQRHGHRIPHRDDHLHRNGDRELLSRPRPVRRYKFRR